MNQNAGYPYSVTLRRTNSNSTKYYGYYPKSPYDVEHYRTPGSKNGQRLYQYKDGSLTPLGRIHYGVGPARDSKVIEADNARRAEKRAERQSARDAIRSEKQAQKDAVAAEKQAKKDAAAAEKADMDRRIETAKKNKLMRVHPEWMSDAGKMKWNLSVDKKIAFNVGYGASKPVRMSEAFEMFWHAEGMKTEYTGMIEYDGREYVVRAEDSYGYADKNWGSDYTSPWLWLASNNLVSKKTGKRLTDSAFDIGGGSPGIGGFEIPDKLLGAMYYEGTEMEFNFTKVWTEPKTRFECKETDTELIWHVELQNAAYVMLTNIKCKKSDMLLINYEAPDGLKLHNRLWNGGNGEGVIKLYRKMGDEKELIDELYARNVGCEGGEFDL